MVTMVQPTRQVEVRIGSITTQVVRMEVHPRSVPPNKLKEQNSMRVAILIMAK
jgi:hypothetical protein